MFEKTTSTFIINKECRGIITAFDLLLFFCVCVFFPFLNIEQNCLNLELALIGKS